MSTPLNEKVVSNLEAVLNDMYPKQEYEGTWITAENTVDGMTGKVVAEEETDITVCNRNIIDVSQCKALYNCSLVEVDEENEKITFSHTSTTNPSIRLRDLKIPAGTYRFYAYFQGSIRFKDADGNNLVIVSGARYTSSAYDDIIELTDTCTTIQFGINPQNYDDGSYNEEDSTFYVKFSDFILQKGEDEINYVRHKEQNYTGKEIDIKTYGDVTHIFNTADVNMQAEIRVKEE